MIRVIVSLCLAGVLIYTANHLWSERNAEFPFSIEEYLIQEPQFTDHERKLAVLGLKLFEDPRLSGNGSVSCSSCHKAELSFSDDKEFSQGIGLTELNTPPIFNTHLQKWFFWDGRADSLTAQSLQPIMHPKEHGLSLSKLAQILHKYYKSDLETVFSYKFPKAMEKALSQDLPAMGSLNKDLLPEVNKIAIMFGDALAEYQRGLVAMDSPYDKFMRAYAEADGEVTFVEGFDSQEWRGFNLFLSKTICSECHTGKNFSDQKFHFTGLAKTDAVGRLEGIKKLQADPFRCHRKEQNCEENIQALTGQAKQVKTPSLRNLSSTGPYFHDGSAKTVRDILYLYNRPEPKEGTDSRMKNLYLTVGEIEDLEAFILSLSSPVRDLTKEFLAKKVKTP